MILNYTTRIDPFKTIGEIQLIISKRGAKSITIIYDDEGAPVGLTFLMVIKGASVSFKLPSNYQGVLRVMAKSKKPLKVKINKEQAVRVSWRIIKNWIEAQMALIDTELALMEQVFLPFATDRNGVTIFEHFQQNTLLKLEEWN